MSPPNSKKNLFDCIRISLQDLDLIAINQDLDWAIIRFMEKRSEDAIKNLREFIDHAFKHLFKCLNPKSSKPVNLDWKEEKNETYYIQLKSRIFPELKFPDIFLLDGLRKFYKKGSSKEHDIHPKPVSGAELERDLANGIKIYLLLIRIVQEIKQNNTISNYPPIAIVSHFPELMGISNKELVESYIDFILLNLGDELIKIGILDEEQIENSNYLKNYFPFIPLSQYLIQNQLKQEASNQQGNLRMAGPQLGDFTENTYLYIPKITQEVLDNLFHKQSVKLLGKSGLGKTTLGRMVGFFYSNNITRVDLNDPFANIVSDYPNPVFYFDFFGQEGWKIKESLNRLKNLEKHLLGLFLIIIDNSHLLSIDEFQEIKALQEKYCLLLIEKGESSDINPPSPSPLLQLFGSPNEEVINQKKELIVIDLNKDEHYITDVATGILYNANPSLNVTSFVGQILPKDTSFLSQGFSQGKKLEENLWTINFVAKILQTDYRDVKQNPGLQAILTDFRAFQNQIRNWIKIRFNQYLVHCRETHTPLQASIERKIEDHFEFGFILLSLLSQFEIAMEKQFFQTLETIYKSRSLPELSNFRIKMHQIDYKYTIMIDIFDFLVSKGDILQKRAADSEMQYFLPHQKLATIVKNALLYPLTPDEVRQYQRDFFKLYIGLGRYFGDLMKILQSPYSYTTSEESQYHRLFGSDEGQRKKNIEADFYLQTLLMEIPPEKMLTQLQNQELSQVIKAFEIFDLIYDPNPDNYRQFYNEQAAQYIPAGISDQLGVFFRKIYPNASFFDGLMHEILYRDLSRTKNHPTLDNLQAIHYNWFYNTSKSDSYEDFFIRNQTPVLNAIKTKSMDNLIYNFYSDIKGDQEHPKSDRFWKLIFDLLSPTLLKSISDQEIFHDERIIKEFLEISEYRERIFPFFVKFFENEIKKTDAVDIFYVLDKLTKIELNHNGAVTFFSYFFPDDESALRMLRQKFTQRKGSSLGQFFDRGLNYGQSNPTIKKIFSEFLKKERALITKKINSLSLLEFLDNFLGILVFNFRKVREERFEFILSLYPDKNPIIQMYRMYHFENIDSFQSIYTKLEIYCNFYELTNDNDFLPITEEKISGLIENLPDFHNVEEFLNQFGNSTRMAVSERAPILILKALITQQYPFFKRSLSHLTFEQIIDIFGQFDVYINRYKENPKSSDEALDQIIKKFINQIFPTKKAENDFFESILLPKAHEWIDAGIFSVVLHLNKNTILAGFTSKLIKALRINQNYMVLYDSTLPYFISSQVIRHSDCGPFFKFLSYFDNSIYQWKNKGKKNSVEFNEALISQGKAVIDQSIENLIGNPLQQFILQKHPTNLFIYLGQILLYSPQATVKIWQTYSNKLVEKINSCSENLLFSGWYFLLLYRLTQERPEFLPLQTEITEIIGKIENMDAFQFAILQIFNYLAYTNQYTRDDFTTEMNSKIYPELLQNKEGTLFDLLASFKLYLPITNSRGLPEQLLPIFFGEINSIFPNEHLTPFIPPNHFTQGYQFTFDELLPETLKGQVIENARAYSWSNRHFWLRQQPFICRFLYNSLLNGQILSLIDEEISFAELHSLIGYLKLGFAFMLDEAYERSGEDEKNIEIRLHQFYIGKMPRLAKDFGKKEGGYNAQSPFYQSITDLIRENFSPFCERLIKLFDHENILDNLILNELGFQEVIILLFEFSGFYSPMIDFLIKKIDGVFENSPEIFEDINPRGSIFLFKFLFVLFDSFKKQIPIFRRKYVKYREFVIRTIQSEGAQAIHSILFQGFSLGFIDFLLEDLESEIIKLLEQDNPFWNLGIFLGPKDPILNKFLDRFQNDLKQSLRKTRIDSIFY